MKIRKRITVGFTSIYSTIIIPLALIIYFSVSSSRQNVFFNQLKERVEITEKFFLESDKLASDIRVTMRENFLKTLPNEIEYVDELNSFDEKVPESIQDLLPDSFLSTLRTDGYAAWFTGKKQGVAKTYYLSSREYVVLVIAEDVYGLAYVNQLKWILIIGVLITITLAFVLSNSFAKKILKPIASKIKKANKISASNLDMRLTVYNEKDELGMLAISFNSLLDRIQEAFEMEKNFIKFASHEIKNPLAVIIGESDLALIKQRSSNEYIEAIEKIQRKAYVLDEFINQFLQLSKLEGENLKFDMIRMDELVLEVISTDNSFSEKEILIELNIDQDLSEEDLMIKAKPALLKNAFSNILNNAKKFSPLSSKIKIDIQMNSGVLTLSIKDEGLGIPAEELDKIFNPLFRAANADVQDGTGLGLALVKKILDVHSFNITAHSTAGEGAQFVIQF